MFFLPKAVTMVLHIYYIKKSSTRYSHPKTKTEKKTEKINVTEKKERRKKKSHSVEPFF